MKRPEQEIQRAVTAHYAARAFPGVFMFAVPNGGYRRRVEAAIMKGTGTVAGVPDTIWIREGKIFGLELKAPSGKLSGRQADIMEEMESCGAICYVAFGLDDALAWLEAQHLLKGRAA